MDTGGLTVQPLFELLDPSSKRLDHFLKAAMSRFTAPGILSHSSLEKGWFQTLAS
jgi:hypothetical protein